LQGIGKGGRHRKEAEVPLEHRFLDKRREVLSGQRKENVSSKQAKTARGRQKEVYGPKSLKNKEKKNAWDGGGIRTNLSQVSARPASLAIKRTTKQEEKSVITPEKDFEGRKLHGRRALPGDPIRKSAQLAG